MFKKEKVTVPVISLLIFGRSAGQELLTVRVGAAIPGLWYTSNKFPGSYRNKTWMVTDCHELRSKYSMYKEHYILKSNQFLQLTPEPKLVSVESNKCFYVLHSGTVPQRKCRYLQFKTKLLNCLRLKHKIQPFIHYILGQQQQLVLFQKITKGIYLTLLLFPFLQQHHHNPHFLV